MAQSDDTAAEAALAIAETHSPEAFTVLHGRFLEERDRWFRSDLLSGIALTRQQAAFEFLLDFVRKESPKAEAVIGAILRSAPSPELVKQLEQMVSGNPRLSGALDKHRRARS